VIDFDGTLSTSDMEPLRLPAQPVDATHALNPSAGVLKFGLLPVPWTPTYAFKASSNCIGNI
jgi:hypothetical protein